MEELVLTVEQCKHLISLGLDISDANFCHHHYKNDYEDYFKIEKLSDCKREYFIDNYKFLKDIDIVPTYTLHEIFEKLPDHIVYNNKYYSLIINFNECWIVCISVENNKYILNIYSLIGDILKASYDMLCWVIENGYLKTK